MTQLIKTETSIENVEDEKAETMNAGKQIHGLSLVEQDDGNASGGEFNTHPSTRPPPAATPFNRNNLADPNLCIDEMNKRYAVVNAGNKVVVIDEYADTMAYLSKEAFHDLYLNMMVKVGDSYVPAGKYWFQHPDRRQYIDGLVFDPSGTSSPHKYNLWKGFAVSPDSSMSCQRLLRHLLEVICDGDTQCYEYLLDWLALLVQKPGQLPGVAICLLSEQGTGKGVPLSYIGKMLGKHYKHITNKGQLLGQFTGHLEDAVLVFADELHWEDNKAETGIECWLYEIADSGEASAINRSLIGEWPNKINKQLFYEFYRQWRVDRGFRGATENIAAFTGTLKRFGLKQAKMPKNDVGRRPQGYSLPTIVELRTAIDEALGHPAPWDHN